jgi:hypothetical protein
MAEATDSVQAMADRPTACGGQRALTHLLCPGHPIGYWLLTLLPIITCLAVREAWALPTRVHAVIAYEAARCPGVPAEFASAMVIGSPDNPIGEDHNDNLCEGAFDEDYDRTPQTLFDLLDLFNRDLIWGQGSHFWNPYAGPLGGQLRVMNPPPPQNAWQRGAMLYGQAVALYQTDHGGAYYLLGRAVHMLTDMATPAHTHLDAHVSDAVASLLDTQILSADCFERYLGWHYVTRLDMPSDPDPTGRLRFERDFVAAPIRPATPAYLSDGWHPELGDLYKLFYSMARQSARWDSNNVNGTGPVGIGGGTLRWPLKIDVAFSDPASIQVWQVDASGRRTRIEPIATVGQARILLPDRRFAGSDRIEVMHDGTRTVLPVSQIERFSQIADADCRRMAEDLMPKAVAHTAALYRLFWRDTHPNDNILDAIEVPGDVDDDGYVTILDLFAVLNGFGLDAGDASFEGRADLDGSGQVDMADVLIVVDHFGWAR